MWTWPSQMRNAPSNIPNYHSSFGRASGKLAEHGLETAELLMDLFYVYIEVKACQFMHNTVYHNKCSTVSECGILHEMKRQDHSLILLNEETLMWFLPHPIPEKIASTKYCSKYCRGS